MAGERIGYIRVSSPSQNSARQLAGIPLDRTFRDTVSGATKDRPGLSALLDYVREGDHLFIHSMDRLARNLPDLHRLVGSLTARGVQITFHKEGLHFSNENSPMANLLLSLLGAVAEFEREKIRERQREGINAAKLRGAFKGRKPALLEDQIEELRTDANLKGIGVSDLARKYGISRPTVYKYLRSKK